MRRLEIEEITNEQGVVTEIRISKQTHRGCNFGNRDGGNFFNYKGFALASSMVPQVSSKMLYVRGTHGAGDNIVLTVPSQEWLERMRAAVEAYNREFSDCNTCKKRHCNACEHKR
jgi:hypothetical protein